VAQASLGKVEKLGKAYFYRRIADHFVFVIPTFEEEEDKLFVEIVVCGKSVEGPYFNPIRLGLSEARFVVDAIQALRELYRT